jgi:DNA ligase D-like protein (predicted polymerase)
MAKAAAEILTAGGREVRVSSPDRIVFEASEHTPAFTKLDVCQYFATVGDVLVRVIGERPTALERWQNGYREGMVLTTAAQAGDGFYSKRLPKGAPEWVETVRVLTPNGRPIDEFCSSEPAAFVWAAQMGTLTFHPWPVRRPDIDHPDELRIDLDPHDGATFPDVRRVALATKELFEELGVRAYPKTSGNRGIHVYVRIEPRWTFDDVRHAAIGVGRELERRGTGATTHWWKEERPYGSISIDFNQNLRDRSVASAWSVRAKAGAPVSTPMTWEHLAGVDDPRAYNLATTPDYIADGDPWQDMDAVQHSLEPMLELWESLPGGELNWPPEYPKMPGEPPRVQPSKKVAEHWDEHGNRL